MASREEKITGLSDQQALSILDSLAGEYANDETPEGRSDQSQALQVLFEKQGQAIDVTHAASADTAAAGKAARELLSIIAQVPEMQSSLDQWLDAPPTQEMAALPLVLAAPIVLTGCIVLLQVAAQTRIVRHPDGSLEWKYDPSMETALGSQMKDIVKSLAGVMGAMTPGEAPPPSGGNAGDGKDDNQE